MTEECAEPDAPKENCVSCGKIVHTCERKTPVNDSYLCPAHGEGWQLDDGVWVCGAECEEKYFRRESFKRDIKFFHPFNFLVFRKPKMDPEWHPSDDLYQYGFSLDLTTELYYYTYDWGRGINFRILGFGFEWTKVDA